MFGSNVLSTTLKNALLQKRNVMHAVILRDLRSRAFNHGLGFLMVPLFPLAHLGLLLLFYRLIGRETPFGEDLNLFFATGLLPALLFMYVSRYMSVSVLINKSMLGFPVVYLLDIVLARAALEMFGIFLAVIVMAIILYIAGSNIVPVDITQAVLAMVVTAVCAIGIGMMVSVIAGIYPFFALIFALFLVLFYICSGAFIYLHIFPSQLVEILAWNPIFHSVEWMRSAYFIGYPQTYLDKIYLCTYALTSVALGLIMERILRRRVMAA